MKHFEYSLTDEFRFNELSEYEQKRLDQLEELDHRFYQITKELSKIRDDIVETDQYNEALQSNLSKIFVYDHCHFLNAIVRHFRQSLLYSAAEIRKGHKIENVEELDTSTDEKLNKNYREIVDKFFRSK